jgi:outer membrane usher protein
MPNEAAAIGDGSTDARTQLAQTEPAPAPTTPEFHPVLRAPVEITGRLVPLEVSINGARAGDWVLLDLNGTLYAPIDAFEEWRVVRRPEVEGLPYKGQLWFPLSSVPGYESRLNAANQSLDLKFSPSAFAITRLVQQTAKRPEVSVPLTSLFANYDISYTRSNFGGEVTTRDLGALTELGVSSRLGVLTSSYVGRNLANDTNLGSSKWVRLETTFNRDFPDNNASLRVGDSTTRTGIWGRSVYFGGVQLARNFALSPGFITQPIPVLKGQASAPSTVDLYINDSLRQTSQVPSGPFTVDNAPLVTGSGQARIVVRDLLGRETVVVQDFFTHSSLLRQGLSDWSGEVGKVRNNLGTDSADYGENFGSGLFRYGVNNGLTLESRAEGSGRTLGAGLGVTAQLPAQILGEIAVAGSKDDFNGSGGQWLLDAEYLNLRHGFTARTESATSGYRRIGQLDPTPPYRRQDFLSYTYFSERVGQFGLAYARLATYTADPVTTFSGNYTMRIGQRTSLTVTATRAIGGPSGDTTVGLNLVIPLDNRITLSGSTTTRSTGTDGYVSANKSLGLESGESWRVLAGRRAEADYAEGGLYYQGGHGLVTADVSESSNQRSVRLGAQGGLVLADGSAFASRRIQDSFALVEVPGYSGVGVGFQSSVLTRTDSNGKALVPGLIPYRSNSIRLDPNELPISAELDTIEMVAVPPARSGVKVAFPVRSGRGALIKIVLQDGQPAPAGAEIRLAGDNKDFYVARHGEAFVTGLQDKNTLRLKWNGQVCDLKFDLPAGKSDDIARVGPLVCSGVKQ